ncbi:MAG TPA: hypothetical protein VJQ25_14375 [Nitrospira sp.]|nr:hypothetical protein [Nitrospira sp.]
MTKPAKHDSQGKGRVVKRPQSGELTCSEGQVEDMLSAGESTEEEPIRLPQFSERKQSPRNTLAAIHKGRNARTEG